jgi:hypothetical protein
VLFRMLQLCHLIFGILLFSAASDAKWIYPPPLPSGTTLSDFASGSLTSDLTYAVHDTILGSFEPSDVDLYIIYRCTHTPTNTPIYPSNLTISSAEGTLAADGTWEYPWTYLSWAYSNAFSPGQDLLVFAAFPTPNTTVGPLCWFELSTGTDKTNSEPPFNRSISLNGGDSAHHFTTKPFNIVPARAVNTTWTISGNASESGQGSPGFTLSIGSQPTATGGSAQPSATHSGACSAYLWCQNSFYGITLLWTIFVSTIILSW